MAQRNIWKMGSCGIDSCGKQEAQQILGSLEH